MDNILKLIAERFAANCNSHSDRMRVVDRSRLSGSWYIRMNADRERSK